MIVGRVISGLATGIFYILPATFANKWFPPNEIATAFCVPFAGFSTGGVIAAIATPYLIPTNINNTSSPSSVDSDSIDEVGNILSIVFGIGTGVMAGVSILFWIYARDGPPSPPSEAEAFISGRTDNKVFNFSSDLRVALKLLWNRSFLLITAANFVSNSALVLFLVIMPSMIFATFPGISNTTVGYMNAVGFACSTISTVSGGKLLDKVGSYKTCSCVGESSR